MIEPKPAELDDYTIRQLKNCISDIVMKLNEIDEERRRLESRRKLLTTYYYNRLARDANQT